MTDSNHDGTDVALDRRGEARRDFLKKVAMTWPGAMSLAAAGASAQETAAVADTGPRSRYRVLGFSCGSLNGMSETLLKEALMGVQEESGAAVELLRMHDLDIPVIMRASDSPQHAARRPNDDSAFLVDRILDSDALIISSPVYTRSPPGQLKAICDSVLGPHMDVAFQIERLKATEQRGEPPPADFDERILKNRVGGFLSIGGSITPEWVSFSLPQLHMMTFSMQINIVDQLQHQGGDSILLDDAAMARTRQLGRNVASQLGKGTDDFEFLGDHEGTCPVCHLDMMIMRPQGIECAVCGIMGQLEVRAGKPAVVFSEEAQARSILKLEGKRIHYHELQDEARRRAPLADDIARRKEAYERYRPYIRPPRA